MSRPIGSLSSSDTDTDDYPADNELSSNLPMHNDDDFDFDKENQPPLINHQPPPHRPTTRTSSSSPVKRPPHKRQRPSSSSAVAANGDPQLVLLDIGGAQFKTSRATLLSIPSTYFFALLNFPSPTPSHAPLFIDRDAAHFRHVLNYMRDRSLPDGLTARELSELHREAAYYAIDELAQHIDALLGDMKRRDEEAERRRERERLLLLQANAEASERQLQQRSQSNPLLLVAAHVQTAQRAVSTALPEIQFDAEF